MATSALIGTAKGLFVLSGERGGLFGERGPLFPGENVDATLLDTAGTPCIPRGSWLR